MSKPTDWARFAGLMLDPEWDAVTDRALAILAKEAKEAGFIRHAFDCEMLRRGRMTILAATIAEQVMGPAQCDCGVSDWLARFREATSDKEKDA